MPRYVQLTGLLLAMLQVTAIHAAPPDAAAVVRDSEGNLLVSWTASNPVDVFVSEQPDAKFASSSLLSAKDVDGRAVLANPGTRRRYFILRDARTRETTHVAERVLALAHGSNFRDIGGYPTMSGRHVKWGMIYRSGATPLLTESDVAQVKALGLVEMIDLRSSEERVIAPTRLTGIRYTAIDYPMTSLMPTASGPSANGMVDLYRRLPRLLAPQLRIVFADLLARNGPIMFHCSAGQDRTGVATAIILSALGVSRETVFADYHLSTQYRHPEYEMPPISPALAETNPVARMFAGYQRAPGGNTPAPLKTSDGRAFLNGAFEEIDARWGSVDGYLTSEIGLTREQLRRLRKAYTQ
ncbi:tyrosine-protein phosphatase [Novosphingobium sp.]|uniref:tyrosine-protein phosphatase n=1 Tax=Novosphingobium sp. TaxID=1874826 RepID=UPI002633EF04|nr:tyrosine-protein phosphatase [Novosphingobium sp.]